MSPRRGHDAVLTGRARAAVSEAAFLRLLGLLFERPREGWRDEARSLAGVQEHKELSETAMTGLEATEGDYLRLFGPGGLVSPREVAYRRFTDPALTLADLSTLYDAFGFRPRAEDPLDHIAVETGFAGYLAMKEAYALSARDREAARRTREARALFLESHLRPFAAGLGPRLRSAGSPDYLDSAARILAGWAGCKALEPLEEERTIDPPEEGELTCGGCDSRPSCDQEVME